MALAVNFMYVNLEGEGWYVSVDSREVILGKLTNSYNSYPHKKYE